MLGSILKEQQIKTLHIYVNELDMTLAKPLLMQVYASKMAKDHEFLLGIWMQLVSEIDTIFNTKAWKNTEKLWACQNSWNTRLLCPSSTPSINFTLFHSIDKCQFKICHILTVLKLAKS